MSGRRRTSWSGLSAWWSCHGGLDGGIRVLGAAAVIMTIEALAGYFLWLGMTIHLHVPDQLGWTLQVGLAGGSAVGTRAFHRGQAGEWQFGLALSVSAVLFLLVDGAVAALLHYDELRVNAGWLAVGVLAECLIVGYLTVHTLMARVVRPAVAESDRAGSAGTAPSPSSPTSRTSPASTSPESDTWGGPEAVTERRDRARDARTVSASAPTPLRRKPVTATAPGKGRTRQELVTAGRALTPPVKRGAKESTAAFRDRVEAGERAARAQRDPDDERERVPA